MNHAPVNPVTKDSFTHEPFRLAQPTLPPPLLVQKSLLVIGSATIPREPLVRVINGLTMPLPSRLAWPMPLLRFQ
jgi:hypothetical protein